MERRGFGRSADFAFWTSPPNMFLSRCLSRHPTRRSPRLLPVTSSSRRLWRPNMSHRFPAPAELGATPNRTWARHRDTARPGEKPVSRLFPRSSINSPPTTEISSGARHQLQSLGIRRLHVSGLSPISDFSPELGDAVDPRTRCLLSIETRRSLPQPDEGRRRPCGFRCGDVFGLTPECRLVESGHAGNLEFRSEQSRRRAFVDRAGQ